ncbi:MAG TPA: NAD(P)/FAD-dependent oxidoreductase [Acidimicrobiales bacterium]|nr:NAD(P)/FAD-dependent oxidoreductase [Acidimicrobiales bacterium]
MTSESRHQVVVVGGGFGGLPATRLLARCNVDVTLLDRRNHHLFQPLLYQVATGILSPGQIAPVLRHLLRRHPNVAVYLATVTDVDLDRRLVHATMGPGGAQTFRYDSLIVAAGANQSYFGHDEFALIAPGMKTIDDALELRRRIYGAFELAENACNEDQRRFWLTVVVVGAGPTGVELAGQVRELAARSLTRDFRRSDPTSVRVVLVDGGKEPLANFGDRLSDRAAAELEHMGVELRMGTRVVGVDPTGVDLEGPGGTERLATGTTIWAAGVQASPLASRLAEASGADIDRAGRIAVLSDLTLPRHPEVFAIGDMARVANLPGICEVAMQEGLHAANTIRRRLSGDTRATPFTYRDLGSAATIGRFKAIVSVRKLRLSGFPGWIVWLVVHVTFLNGFGNRVAALYRWAKAMIGRSRPERVFSVGHTGGDLSLPDTVRRQVMPTPFPAWEAEMGVMDQQHTAAGSGGANPPQAPMV